MTIWISAFAQVGTLIVGAAVVFIAWQQHQLASHKLRLDLFDRRYKVYDATRKFLATVLQEATFTDAQLFEFYAGTSDAEFLFGQEIVDYLKQIRHRALDMRVQQRMYEALPVGEERSRRVQAEHDQLTWLTDQLTAMTAKFSPYIGFSRIA